MKTLLIGLTLLGSLSALANQSLFDDTITSLTKANLECNYDKTDTTLGCLTNSASCKMITTFSCVDEDGVKKAEIIKTQKAQHEGSYLTAKEVIKVETILR